MKDLEGRVAMITGGARGQGLTEAQLFAEHGASVVVGDIRGDDGRSAVSALGPEHTFVDLDVTREADWAAAIEIVRDRYGRLDALVNNAGVHLAAPILETSPEDFRHVTDVNLLGAFLGIRAAVPLMTTSGGGSITNISSVQGLLARAGIIAYVASKFGLRGLTKAAAIELGPAGIRVNSVHPGGVATEMIDEIVGAPLTPAQLDEAHAHLPIARCGRTSDIAPIVVFLATDGASYITGAEIAVDGGMAAGITPQPT